MVMDGVGRLVARAVTDATHVAGTAARMVEGAPAVADSVLEQLRLLAMLPDTIRVANESLQAFAGTVANLDRLVRRLDVLAGSLEEPVEQLAPRLERLVPLLDSTALVRVPEMLDAVTRDALPALAAVAETQAQVANIAGSLDRLTAGLEDAASRLLASASARALAL